ncbi:MAG: NFACT RNA binding domain-containing protein [Candidatus Pacearchaeota archaeon]|nr:NFACT RNA binding domain-containing protein [Candidatus Pacearchaeota archaeon]
MKFREFYTSSNKLILCGKNAEQNEELIKNHTLPYETVLHTKAPGSPFCVIKNKKPSLKDIRETAIICAAFSKDWKLNKKDVEVHIFKGNNISKQKDMKIGTFAVKNAKNIIVKKELITKFLENYNGLNQTINEDE